ncbi:hypothetical protein D3C81_901300 [compost metagenome]
MPHPLPNLGGDGELAQPDSGFRFGGVGLRKRAAGTALPRHPDRHAQSNLAFPDTATIGKLVAAVPQVERRWPRNQGVSLDAAGSGFQPTALGRLYGNRPLPGGIEQGAQIRGRCLRADIGQHPEGRRQA